MKKAFVLLELMNAMVLVAKEAKARGYAVVALNHDPLKTSGPFTVPDGLVDEFVPIASWSAPADVDRVIEQVSRRYEVAGTYAVFEATLPYEAALRERAGLPGNGADRTRDILDKGKVRKRLYEAGLSRLRSASLTEALEWETWPYAGDAVLKPANGTGSALCFVVSSLAELRAAAARVERAEVVNPLMKDYIVARGEFVVEERAAGELMSVESMVCRGEIHLVGLTGRYVLAKDPVVEQGLFFPYHHPRRAEIAAAAGAMHRELGVYHGATHLEVMVADDGTVELIDFNVRFAGFASAVAFGEAFRTPFEALLTDLACGVTPQLSLLEGDTRFTAEMVVLPPPGATELRELTFPPEAIAPRLTKEIGQRLTGRADQLDAVGMFIVAADSASEVHAKALRARRVVIFNGEPLGDNENNVLAFSEYVGADLAPAARAG